MKYFLGMLFLFVSGLVYPETVINYDDGFTYTLEANQEIYISTPSSALFKTQLMSNKDTFFRVQKPWTKRDYVPDEDGTDEMAVGSHEWCKAYTTSAGDMEFVVTFDLLEQPAIFVNFNGA